MKVDLGFRGRFQRCTQHGSSVDTRSRVGPWIVWMRVRLIVFCRICCIFGPPSIRTLRPRWRESRESDSKAFCHRNWMQLVSLAGQTPMLKCHANTTTTTTRLSQACPLPCAVNSRGGLQRAAARGCSHGGGGSDGCARGGDTSSSGDAPLVRGFRTFMLSGHYFTSSFSGSSLLGLGSPEEYRLDSIGR